MTKTILILAIIGAFVIGTIAASPTILAGGGVKVLEMELAVSGSNFPVTVDIVDKKGKSLGIPTQIIATSGDTFTVTSGEFPKDKYESKTFYKITDSSNTVTKIEIHTSCSKPLGVGDVFPSGGSDPQLEVIGPADKICASEFDVIFSAILALQTKDMALMEKDMALMEKDMALMDEDVRLQDEINNIALTPGAKGDKGDKGDTGPQGLQGLSGTGSLAIVTKTELHPILGPVTCDPGTIILGASYLYEDSNLSIVGAENDGNVHVRHSSNSVDVQLPDLGGSFGSPLSITAYCATIVP